MAITHVNTTTGTDPNTGSVTVTKPATTASGDVLLVFGVGTQGAWDTLPSGFTQIAVTTDADFTSNFRMYAWYKVCGGSEPGSYTFGNSTAGSNGSPLIVTMHCWRGVDNASPILHQSVLWGNASSEPANPATTFTQTAAGRVVFARGVRRTSSISGTAQLPTFSPGTAGWSELADVADFSGGTVNYGIGSYAKDADTSSGAQTEPAITCSQTENTNGYFLLCLKAAATPATGAFAETLGHVSASFSGTVHDDAAFASTLGRVTASWTGTHFPPASGTFAVSLGHVTSSFAVTSTGGGFSSQLGHVSASFVGGIVGGSFSSQLGHVTTSWAGDVNPIGSFSSQLSKITTAWVAETRPFGAQVIFIEPEKRGLRITQDDTIPIHLTEVTQE